MSSPLRDPWPKAPGLSGPRIRKLLSQISPTPIQEQRAVDATLFTSTTRRRSHLQIAPRGVIETLSPASGVSSTRRFHSSRSSQHNHPNWQHISRDSFAPQSPKRLMPPILPASPMACRRSFSVFKDPSVLDLRDKDLLEPDAVSAGFFARRQR